jgi:hypothetical protein
MDNLDARRRRTDQQLEAILDEAGHWVVNGRQGQVLCSAASFAAPWIEPTNTVCQVRF